MGIINWINSQFTSKESDNDAFVIKQLEGKLGHNIELAETEIHKKVSYRVNAEKRITELNLSNLGLVSLWEIKDSLEQLSNLKYLSLATNKITDISPLKKLFNLEKLFLTYNQITDISPLSKLTKLKSLYLEANRISDVSPVHNLVNLSTLFLDDNIIINISDLKKLTRLAVLSLSNNKIVNISCLKKLHGLTDLYIDQNNLIDISDLSELINMGHLDLSRNQITDISPLKNLTKLNALTLSWNPIEELPTWITDFDMEISWKEYGYQKKTISLYNNAFKNIPVEIVMQGKKAIRNYFRQLNEQEEDYLFEAKLLILGEPGAGKTTMAWKMENPDSPLPPEENTTKGIDVRQFYFPLKPEDMQSFQYPEKLRGKKFRVNLWDFGGQEIYKATHRFFLSNRSLYALVADSRKEDTDFNYWLHIVEIFGGSSPLLIILNEKFNCKRNIDIAALKKRFTNITEVVDVDFAENSKIRFNILNNAIKYYISKLPHIGSPIPGKWTAVRTSIDNDNRNSITRQDYLTICETNGIGKLEDALLLSKYFHEIGVFLHFQEDDVLNKTIFLKPNWATTAVYKILDHELLNQQKGRFNKDDASSIWKEKEFILLRDELLRLMQKFYLTYEIEKSGEFIVPERLPVGQPEYHFEDKDNLHLRYEYDFFMPKGIMSQLIVEMYSYINDHTLVWKRGVILNRENTLAEIIESYDARSIKIRAAGKNKRDFLTLIIENIDKINSQYDKLKVEKMIPCNCSQCRGSKESHFYKYKILKRRLENGKLEIECENSYENVDVRSLIDDVLKENFIESKEKDY